MMTLWVPSYLFTLHWVLYETDASQDLGVAPHNLTMVPGEKRSLLKHGGGGGGGGRVPLNPGGQLALIQVFKEWNRIFRTHTGLPFSTMEGGSGGVPLQLA